MVAPRPEYPSEPILPWKTQIAEGLCDHPGWNSYWTAGIVFFPVADKLTVSGGIQQEALARMDLRIGALMAEIDRLGIAENTLVVVGADNGGMTHEGPTGMVETLYRGGKGDPTEGAVRVPTMAVWPGVIEPGQTIGDIVHFTDLFTTFARIGNAMDHIPTDRIVDGIDQTALFLNGDGSSRRDYVLTYLGTNLASIVKGRFKWSFVGEAAGMPSNNTFDLYNDPREHNGLLIQALATSGMFLAMRARHELWMEKYPNVSEERGMPLTGIENARPETIAATKPRIDPALLPFDPREFIRKLNEFEGANFDGYDWSARLRDNPRHDKHGGGGGWPSPEPAEQRIARMKKVSSSDSSFSFIKTTVIGGVLFLLPFGIVLVVLGKLYTYVKPTAQLIRNTIFPWAPLALGPVIISVLILITVAFLAGAVARSKQGRWLFNWLEAAILENLPPYMILRQMFSDISGSTGLLSASATNKVVLVRMDDVASFGLLIESRPNGEAIVFLPDAPFALSGAIAVVAPDRIEETNMTQTELILKIRRLGVGLGKNWPQWGVVWDVQTRH